MAHGNSNAQNVHANQNDHAIDAHLNHWDISDVFGTIGGDAVNGTEMWFGDGNLPTNYHLEQNNTLGIELGLKEHYRTGDDIVHDSGTADGTANFTVPAGTQVADPAHDVSTANPDRAAWNFDFVVDTGLNGATTNLSDFTFKIQITQNGTNTHVFDLDPTTHVWVDEANPTVGFGGDDFSHPASANVQSHVAENSVNLAFLTGDFGPLATSTAAGTTYDIQLEAFKGVQLAGLVHDHIVMA